MSKQGFSIEHCNMLGDVPTLVEEGILTIPFGMDLTGVLVSKNKDPLVDAKYKVMIMYEEEPHGE